MAKRCRSKHPRHKSQCEHKQGHNGLCHAEILDPWDELEQMVWWECGKGFRGTLVEAVISGIDTDAVTCMYGGNRTTFTTGSG